MRKLYVVLAWVVALGVVVQAAAMAFAVGGMVHYVQNGGVVDAGSIGPGNGAPAFVGELGFPIHALVGGLVIPIAAFLLMIVSFFVQRPRARTLGIAVFVVAFLQVMAGYSLTEMPYVGLFHGANALILVVTALVAARQATANPTREQAETQSLAGSHRVQS